jgi:hypothetical protein
MWLLVFLIILLIIVVGLIIYANWPTVAAGGASPCTSCGGMTPMNPCGQCNQMPCQCNQVLPGQTQCPQCPGYLNPTSMPGISSCGGCGRGYRCPGCVL